MCLILFSYLNHPRYTLILAANRDEFYDRPTRPLSFWPENTSILAGRDERGAGTWLGVNKEGKIAALTNFRNLSAIKKNGPSRGLLVLDYLQTDVKPVDYLEAIRKESASYSGFNLLAGDRNGLFYYSNMGDEIMEISPGIHGLSNAFLNTSWPKVDRGRRMLADACEDSQRKTEDALFDLLKDSKTPPDKDLPDTGVGREWERVLSPLFIESPTYGTRSSAVILIDHDGWISFAERTYGPSEHGSAHIEFQSSSFS